MYKSLVFFLILVAAGAGIWFLTAEPGVVPADASANRLTAAPPSNSTGEVSIEEPPQAGRVDRPSIANNGPFPQVVIGETVYPFGRMEVGQTNQHTFELKNASEADLVMTAGSSTCKCTTFGFGVDAAA